MTVAAYPGDAPKVTQLNAVKEALKRYKSIASSIFAFSAVSNSLMIVPALYMLQVYDRVLTSRNEMTLAMLTLIALGMYVLVSALDYLRSILLIRCGSRLDIELSQTVHDATVRSGFSSQRASMAQALGDLATLRGFIQHNGLIAFMDLIWFPFYLLVLFLFDLRLGLLASVGVVLLISLAHITEKISRVPTKLANEKLLRSNAMADAHLRGAETAISMGMMTALSSRWERAHSQSVHENQRVHERVTAITALTRFLRLALQSLMLGLGALLAIDGVITPGMMIAASIILSRTLAPIEQVIAVWKQCLNTRQAYNRLNELLIQYPAPAPQMSLPAPEGRLTATNISFYRSFKSGENPRPIFTQLNLAVAPGQMLVILGPSGVGKTTLAKILAGLTAPTSGQIHLDGAELSAWNSDARGTFLGYMPQGSPFFEGTIADNIARFQAQDSELIIQAANDADCHEMIMRLPLGYETRLNDSANSLSSGQLQRIALARALYGRPAIVIMDEPNSNLDEAGDIALTSAIRTLKSRKATVVLITHRANLLHQSDLILVLRPDHAPVFGPTEKILAPQQQFNGQQSVAQGRSA